MGSVLEPYDVQFRALGLVAVSYSLKFRISR